MLNKNPVKVLVAEDDFLVCEDIIRHLKQKGYQHIGSAPNGEKALAMVKELKPDVIIMDVKMPKMDGLQTISLIQQECPTPVVILTAHESADIVNRASQAGAAAFLTKPPNAEEIDRAITIAMARHNDLLKSMQLVKELEKSQRALEEHKKTLQTTNAQKDKLFSIIAHDLRSPFVALMGYSEMLSSDYYEFNDLERLEYINSISECANSTFMLLNNLLNWSRAQRDKLELTFREYNIYDLINTVIETLKGFGEQKGITINNLVKNEIDLQIDYDTMLIVFSNLISNAVKFTPSGGEINIHSMTGGTKVSIIVADNGQGIEKERLKDLFNVENLNSTPGTDNEQGTGLGLILCKEFVEKNNGTLEVRSEENKGSQFIITFGN
ncbi:MAG: response regulator [Rhodothermaceae bacterium]